MQKRETLIYEGLGFPIRLIGVPMKQIFGEWVIDIDFIVLQKVALNMLALKRTPLTGAELRFIIDFLEMPTREFAKIFGVSHTAVLKWLKESSKMNSSTEVYLRLYLLNYLNVTDKEFKRAYLKVTPESIAILSTENSPLEIDAAILGAA